MKILQLSRKIRFIKEYIRKKIKLWVHSEIVINNVRNSVIASNSKGISENKIIDEQLIVSLTTYSKRIDDVHLVIESIMEQTILPNKIILWLDEEEFEDSTLPCQLIKLKERGLSIKYCKDYKSYKKIIPTLISYPNATIITIDDDIIYPNIFIEKFIEAYKKNKRCIYYYRGRRIEKKNGYMLPYSKWKMTQSGDLSFDVIPTGVGGIFYPAGCFDKRVLDEETWKSLCPKADDVWLRAMTMLKGYYCKNINLSDDFDYNFISLESNQDIALTRTNVYGNENDLQIKAVFEAFKLINT